VGSPTASAVPARIVGWDLFTDIGVVKVDPDEHRLAPVPLGDSSVGFVGEPVAAIGSPFGQQSSLAVGVVSATERAVDSLTSAYSVIDVIQTDAPINPGNSGGPLFNARGEVIGINAQIRSDSGNAEGVGFAIPINSARRSLDQLAHRSRAIRVSGSTLHHAGHRGCVRPRRRARGPDHAGRVGRPPRAGLRGGSRTERSTASTSRSAET
jgi:S1-C subfamily serine protease